VEDFTSLSLSFSSHLDDSYVNVLNYLIIHSNFRRCYLDVLFQRMFSMVQNIALPFGKVGLPVPNRKQTLVCLMLTLNVETVLPIDALR
jgi:hypothetical protein